jgi:hypothetical protein
MTFPVNGSIPGANDDPSISQGQIQTNFNNILGWSSIDHVQYGAANAGTHNQVTMLTPNVSDPSLSGTQGEVYTKAVSGLAQLFFANATTVTQLTGGASSLTGNGYIKFPGGLILQWGSGSSSSGGSGNTFPLTFPSSCFVVNFIPVAGTPRSFSTSSVSTSGFTAYASSSAPIYYIAIGN